MSIPQDSKFLITKSGGVDKIDEGVCFKKIRKEKKRTNFGIVVKVKFSPLVLLCLRAPLFL